MLPVCRRRFASRLVPTVVAAIAAATAHVAGQGPLVPGANVNMVRGTSFVGGDAFLQRQNEPSLAVSTRNPCHLLAGANDYRTVDFPDPTPLPNEGGVTQAPSQNTRDAWLGVFKSMDCGTTWRSELLPGHPFDTSLAGTTSPNFGYTSGADPVVRAGTNGLFFYAGLVFDRGNQSRSQVFVARFIDNNNKERGDTIAYVDASSVDVGDADTFVDKPWVAVDQPRAGAAMCDINGQRFPAGRVYAAWARFEGAGARIMLARSLDCGRSWQTQSLSDTAQTNQGASIAIAPHDGTVYVVWRRFASDSTPSSIQIAASRDGGATFTRNAVVPTINAFDQTKEVNRRFRTNTLPTVAADHLGRVYVAWAERGFALASGRTSPTTGDARIVLAVSSDFGRTFAPRYPIDDTLVDADGAARFGHQVMPALTFTAGKIQAVYYDFSDDIANTFNQFIDEAETPPVDPNNPDVRRRHTVDVRAATADPAVRPVFAPVIITPTGTSPRLSQYRTIVDPDGTVRQVQFNPPNLPIFVGGTIPFIGDYIDVAGLNFVPFQGGWRHNNGTTSGPAFNGAFPSLPVFHAAWTDHRDVKPPADGDWTLYKAPGDPFWSLPGSACVPDRAGMRNANVYTARIGNGLYAGSPGNTKPLGFQRNPQTGAVVVDPTTGRPVHMQRSFVVFVQNSLRIPKTYLLRILNQPGTAPGERATFLRAPQPPYSDADLATRPFIWLVVKVPPLSTISRTVFVTSANERAMVRVDVLEVAPPAPTALTVGTLQQPFPTPLAGGLRATVLLNPDPTNPAVLDADNTSPDVPHLAEEETHDPEIFDPVVTTIGNVKNTLIELRNPDEANPDEANPDEANIDEEMPDEANPDEANPDEANPDEANPDEANPDEANVGLQNTALPDAQLTNAHVVDVQWKVRNNGNTTTSFRFSPTFSGERTQKHFQLLVTKRYYVPAVDGITCDLGVRRTNQVLVNVSGFNPKNPDEANPDEANPDEANPDEANPDEANPDEANPDEANATFFLAPGETATATLRIYDTSTPVPPPPAQLATFEDSAAAVVQSQAPNTGEALPPRDAAGSDLVAANAVASPGNVAPGATAQVAWTLANRGTEATPSGSFRTRFLFSTDRDISETDRQLAEVTFTGSVPADDPATPAINEGEIHQIANVTVPADVTTGPRFILVVTDALNDVPEADETNNAAATQLGGASALAFSVQPTTVTQGFRFTTPIRVALLDPAGQPASPAAVPQVRLAVASGPAGAALVGTLTVANIGGFATFADVVVSAPGTYTLLAIGVGLELPIFASPAVSAPFVVEPDDPPVAVADSYTVAAGGILNVSSAALNRLTGNDIDELLAGGPGSAPPGRALSIVLVQSVAHGTLAIGAGGGFIYTAAAGFNGVDFFTYQLNDGITAGNVATARMVVGTGGNAAPVTRPLSITIAEDGPEQTIDIAANSLDADGDTLTVSSATASNGAVVRSGGLIRYIPNLNYFGADTIAYVISDGHGGDTAGSVNVTITPVNDNPVAVNDGPFDVAVNAPATTYQVLANDNDGPDFDETLTITRVGGALHGRVTFTAATVTYTPNQGYEGTDNFGYEISDGHGGVASALVGVNVGDANRTPTARADQASTNEDMLANINVVLNDVDPDLDPLGVTAVTQGEHGSVVVVSPTTVRYTPADHFNGTDTFSYTVADSRGASATAQVTVTVAAVNDSPSLVTTMPDRVASVGTPDTIIDLSAYFTDVDIATDIDFLTFSVVENTNPAVVGATVNGASLTLHYTATGTSLITVRATDSHDAFVTDAFLVTVTAATGNQAPVANPDNAATTSGTPVTINVLANDTDPDREVGGARVVASVSFNPPAFVGYNGFIQTLAAGPGTRYLYAGATAGIASAGVTVIDSSTNAAVAFISSPIADGPTVSAVDPVAGLVYFATSQSVVFAVDARPASATFNQIVFYQSIAGSRINGLVVDSARQRLYVLSETFASMGSTATGAQSRVMVLDMNPANDPFGQLIRVEPLVSTTAAFAALNPVNGNLLIGTTGANSGLYVMDRLTFGIASITGTLPVLELAIDAGAGRAYGLSSGGQLLAFDLATQALIANSTFAVPGLASPNAFTTLRHIVVDSDTGRVFVRSNGNAGSTGSVFVLQPGGATTFWSVVTQIAVGRDSGGSDDLVIDTATDRLITSSGLDLRIDVIDTVTNTLNTVAHTRQAAVDLELLIFGSTRRVYADALDSVAALDLAPVAQVPEVYLGTETSNVSLNPNTHEAFVGTADTQSHIFALNGGGLIGETPGTLSSNGGRYVFAAAGNAANQVYVLNTDSNSSGSANTPGFVSVINSNGVVVRTFDAGNGAFGMLVNQASGRLHVPASGRGGQPGGVTVIDPATGTTSAVNTSALFTTNVARNIAVVEALGKVYIQPAVVDTGGSNLGVYTEAGLVATRLPASLGATAINVIRVNNTTRKVYIGNRSGGLPNRVLVINANNDSLITALTLGSPSNTITTQSYIAIDEVHGRVYIADFDNDLLHIVDAANENLLATLHVGDGPTAVAVNAASNRVYVGSTLDNRLTFVDGASMTVRGALDLQLAPTFLDVDPIANRIFASSGRSTLPAGNGVMVIADDNTYFTNPLTIASVSSGAAGGTAVVNPDQTITFIPDPNAPGGQFNYTITDGVSESAPARVTIGITPAMTITPATLPNGTAGANYFTTLDTANGHGVITWAIVGGVLPSGLTLTSLGEIAGGLAASGTYTFTVGAQDQSTPAQIATRTYTVRVGPLSITSIGLPTGLVGEPYAFTFVASGATGATTWSIASGTLPNGLTLGTSGAISGVPTIVASFPFSVRVMDETGASAVGNFSILIDGNPTLLDPPVMTELHSSYNFAPYRVGRSPVSLTVVNGTLPSGITVSAGGALTGTPQQTGQFPLRLRVVDGRGRVVEGDVVLSAAAVDESIASITGGTTQTFGPTRRLAQTFTAGADGQLAGVRSPQLFCSSGDLFTVELRRVSGADVPLPLEDGPPLATAASIVNANGQVAVQFTPFVSFSAGERFAVIYNTTGACEFRNVGPTNYLHGHGLVSSGGGPWQRLPGGADIPVATLIQPDGLSYFTEGGYGSPTATTLANGDVLIANGGNVASVFAPTTGDVRRTTGNPLVVRNNHSAVLLDDGRVLIVGGERFDSTLSASVFLTEAEAYNGLGFQLVGPLAGARSRHGMVKLPDGRVLVAGGWNGVTSLDSIEIFTPGPDQFTSGGTMLTARSDTSVLLLACPAANPGCTFGGKVLIAGGSVAELYDPITGTSTAIPGSLLAFRGFRHTATQLLDGRVLFAGGTSSTLGAEILDVVTGTSVALAGSEALRIERHTATRAADGSVIFTGGRDSDQFEFDYRRGVFRFDPATSTIRGAGSMKMFRHTHTASLLADGRLLLAGGSFFGGSGLPSRSFEFFNSDPAANVGFTTVLLPNGQRSVAYPATTLQAAGGTPPYTFTRITGELPPGLSMANGVISGTPTPAALGAYSFVVRVTDSAPVPHASTMPFTIRVDGISITTASLPGGSVGAPYSAQLQATGTAPFTWSITSNVLPAGLTLSAAGAITGTPTASISLSFRVRVEDATGQVAARWLFIDIAVPPTIVSIAPMVLHEFQEQAPYTGGIGPYVLTVVDGSLPRGMTITPAGTISGTPQATGVIPVSLRVVDSRGGVGTGFINILAIARDQFIGTQIGGSTQPFGPTRRIAQTYTAGASGALSAVRLNSAFCSTGSIVGIEVRRVIGSNLALPDESQPAVASGSAAGVSGALIPLTPRVSFVVGERFAIVLTTTGACELRTVVTNVATYPVGDALESAGGGPWQRITGAADLPVETLIVPTQLFYLTQSFSSGHSASVLPNGDVLVAGTGQTADVLSAAGFSSRTTNDMLARRSAHRATVLDDGSVLIAGGVSTTGGTNYPTQAERYVFVSGLFQATGTMAQGRSNHTATKLADGRVVVAGGENIFLTGSVVSSVEIYTPGTGTFSPGGALLNARDDHYAVLLACPTGNPGCAWGGRILIAGGDRALGSPSAELYNPATLSSAATAGAMMQSRARGTATLLADGRVLFVGGSNSLPSAEIFNPATGLFTAASNSPLLLRFNHTATLFADGTVVIAGGTLADAANNFEDRADVLRFDPETSTVIGAGALQVKRRFHAPVTLPNGRLLMVGGFSSSQVASQSAELVNVNVPGQVFITTVDLPNGQRNVVYPTTSLQATGGTAPYNFAVLSGTLPPGLTFVNGTISGTPSAAAGGTYRFIVEVTDSALHNAQASLAITINGLTITTTSLPNGAVSQPYSQQLQATGIAPFTWTLQSGSLPAGLTLSQPGLISGTPTIAGSPGFTVRVQDAVGQFATRFLSITIGSSLQLLNPPPAIFQSFYSRNLASGGSSPYTLTLLNGTLPRGLAISGATVSGIPEVAGQFPVELRLADTTGANVTRSVVFESVATDQAIGFTSPGTTQAFGPTRRVAQTFTAGADGMLAAIRPSNTVVCNGTDVPTYEVRRATGSNVVFPDEGGPPLATATGNPPSGTPLLLDARPLFRAGERFVLVISTTGACEFRNVAAADDFVYQFGSALESVGGGAWTRIADALDLPLMTMIVPVGFEYLTTFTFGHQAALLPNGDVFMLGSSGQPQVFSPATGNSQVLTGTFMSRSEHTVTALDDGRALIVGGFGFTPPSGSSDYTAQVDIFQNGAITTTTPLSAPRAYHTATKLPDGRVVVAGGFDASGFLTTIEIFNPATNTWTPGGSFLVSRAYHAATLLTCPTGVPCAWGGKILITGGNFGSALSAEVYDPATGTSTATTGPMVLNRGYRHWATRLGDGRVVVIGGTSGAPGAELFNPATGTFTAVTNSADLLLTGATMTGLSDGSAIVAGGYTVTADDLEYNLNLYKFDLATSTFGVAGRLALYRTEHSATALLNGSVLFAGGFGQNSNVGPYTVETYDPAAPAVAIPTTTLPNGQRNVAYPSTAIQATGGIAPYTFEIVSGTLPPGLTFTNGTIQGMPNNAAGGRYEFTVQVTDSSPAPLTSATILRIQIGSLPSITTATLPDGQVGVPYSVELSATGFAPFMWRLVFSELPTGMTFHSNGVIDGTPTAQGTVSVEVEVEDAFGQVSQRFFNLTVMP